MVRLAAAAFLVAHGVAHVVGFLASWRLGQFAGGGLDTRVLDGNLEVGDAGLRVVGILWLVAALAFVWAAAAVGLNRPHWGRTVAVVAGLSLALCVVGLPQAVIGVLVNLAILMAVAATTLQRRTPAEPPPLRP
jgi:hypothetical protein